MKCLKSTLCTCHVYIVAQAVEPFAQASSNGVIIKWSTPRNNMGCDGLVITRYIIKYMPVNSRDDVYTQVNVDVNTDQPAMEDIDGLVNSTEYHYSVVGIYRNGGSTRSVFKVFTTQDERECLSVCV